MKRLITKISILIILLGGIGIEIFRENNTDFEIFFKNTFEIQHNIRILQTDLSTLEGEILQNAFFPHYNYDTINKYLREIETNIPKLYPKYILNLTIYTPYIKATKELKKSFDGYQKDIQRFMTLNAPLKNTLIYLSRLQQQASEIFDKKSAKDRKVLQLFYNISNLIAITENIQDTKIFSTLKQNEILLKKLMSGYSGKKRELIEIYREHLDIFLPYFSRHIHIIRKILSHKIYKDISHTIKIFQEYNNHQLYQMNKRVQISLIAYFIIFAIFIFFIIKSQQQNLYLSRLKDKLEEALMKDTITGLKSRYAYEIDKYNIKNPNLIIINVNRFKYVNEYYGTKIGDKTLKKIGKYIKEYIPYELDAKIYRIGGDEFGILFEEENLTFPIRKFLQNIYNKLDHTTIEVEGLDIELDYTLGASRDRKWLLETADMALKIAKVSPRTHYLLYEPKFDRRKEIENNLKTLHRIRKAIETKGVVPYFQPIYDTKLERIVKFEALARIELDDGKTILQPYSFIHTAIEAKLNGAITLQILRKTLETAKANPAYEFSVNLTAETILSSDETKEIIKLLEEFKSTTKQILFEILETEEFENYKEVSNFISLIKKYDCKIAIDDFGSGYSNFERILELDIDFIKIDGSLIKKIDSDKNIELVVQTILKFSHHANFKTVAEFVHSKEVFDKVSSMGFDLLQGYYIGEPAKKLKTEFSHTKETD